MANYLGNRHNEYFSYRRVAWSNWMELEEYEFFTDGSIEISADVDIIATGSFNFVSAETPNTDDLIRVYYYFTDDEGSLAEIVLGTFVVSVSSIEYVDNIDGIMASGTLDANSVFSVLNNKLTGRPYVISIGSDAILEAVSIIKSCGLNVEYKNDVNYVFTSSHIFDAGTSYLEIVKWLCSEANSKVYPNEYGTVVIKSDAEVNTNTEYVAFSNGDNSIMYPEVNADSNMAEVPNVVKLMYNTENDCAVAEAVNESGSSASLDVRGGREYTYYESISEIGNTNNILETLKQMAYDMLVEKSADVETVTISHAFLPMYLYTPIMIDYSGMSWTGLVDSMSISLETATKTQTRIKNTNSRNISITTSGTVFREVEDEGNN